MATQFRKSKTAGPFRVTASKSGLSYSTGIKGLRISKGADGRVRSTVGIPGTGVYRTSTIGGSSKTNSLNTLAAEYEQLKALDPEAYEAKTAENRRKVKKVGKVALWVNVVLWSLFLVLLTIL